MNKNAKNINKILKSQADITSNTHEQEQAAKSYGGWKGFWRACIGGVPINFLSRVVVGKNNLKK